MLPSLKQLLHCAPSYYKMNNPTNVAIRRGQVTPSSVPRLYYIGTTYGFISSRCKMNPLMATLRAYKWWHSSKRTPRFSSDASVHCRNSELQTPFLAPTASSATWRTEFTCRGPSEAALRGERFVDARVVGSSCGASVVVVG